MRNLLTETIEVMARNGKFPDEVRWVGTGPQAGTWEDFAALADFEYDGGFGLEEIRLTLKVVGADWWLERHEYDGSEWWEFKELPETPAGAEPLTAQAIRERMRSELH